MKYLIKGLDSYEEWFKDQHLKSQSQIYKRLKMIEKDGHFGHMKDIGEGLSELKFNDGRRIYYTVVNISPTKIIILLLGGNKNGQTQDIKKAKSILKQISQNES